MKTINELLERYGELMHEAGMVKGELLAKLHLAKEFATITEPQVQIVMQPPPSTEKNHVDLLSIPPSERIEYDERYREKGTLAGMIMRVMQEFPTRAVDTDMIYSKALQLYPDRTFSKSRFQQTIYILAEDGLIAKVGRGQYKRKDPNAKDNGDLERVNLGTS
jgi:hypothetical protein